LLVVGASAAERLQHLALGSLQLTDPVRGQQLTP